ncbi:dual specificity phosphatase, catalytic domain containing protein [Acanthamoeba castellanii str. Neff]|uniref:protein-tyrosine-phosphatase n=1 Tax=Acanthamoeba castellanii (strain ATCC 30010 / Neff) TaxID=1257118 RepID=L8GR82_ACACF|nr:dual specificity phosphatase, catalytic domain containing protein [Acanthamoeba castellanii str. Neff]ELR15452.1 dual specificity phosphatase, catalytic domain containing protein [Acanthamoeba castellanii str. Neff]
MEATLLIPNFLYLGSEFNAANRELLIEYNISAIVNAAAPQTANHFIQESSCYRYHSIDLLDAAEEDLLKHIEPYSRFLDEAERKGEVALVHCKSGNSRAAALCIAHLMRRHRWPLAKAFAFVKMKRPAAQPNKGFLEQLAIYQRYLQEEEEQAEQEENDHDDDDKDQDGDEGAQEEEDAMELELARRRAAFMRRYAGGGEDDSSDEGEGEEYEMELDDDQEPLVKGKEKQQPAAVANTNEDLNWEKQRKDEEEDDEEEEREEREEEARRAKAKRDWQRWFAKPPALVDLVVRHRRAALAHRVSALFAAGNWEALCTELKRVYASLRDTPEFVNIVRAAYFAATKADAVAAAAAIVAAQTATGEEAKLDAVVDWRRIQQERLVSTFGTAPEPGFQRAFEQTLPYFLNPLAKTYRRPSGPHPQRSPKEVEDELWPLLESSLPYMGRNAAAFEFHFANALAGRLLSIGPGQNHRFHVERAVAQLVGRFPSFSGFGALMEAMVSDAQFSFEMEEMQKSAAKDKVRQGEESGALVSVRLLAADLWPRRRILPPASKDLTDADMRSWRGVPLANWPKRYQHLPLGVMMHNEEW